MQEISKPKNVLEKSDFASEQNVPETRIFCVLSGGLRVDKFLADALEISRSKISSFIERGALKVNSIPSNDKNYLLKVRDEVEISFETATEIFIKPDASVPFEILFEDEFLAIINKPAGVVVHPGAGNHDATLVNGLVSCYGDALSKDNLRPGIVHRIDKDTSGILVIAKGDFAHQKLAEQFACHSIVRKYVCFCFGVLERKAARIETLISRDRRNRLKMCVSEHEGKKAITIYKTLKKFASFAAKVECELKTGRTHQIRVHMNHLKHSLIGDTLYKYKNYALPAGAEFLRDFSRQALHAYFLEFTHPKTGEVMRFEAPLPPDLLDLETQLDSLVGGGLA